LREENRLLLEELRRALRPALDARVMGASLRLTRLKATEGKNAGGEVIGPCRLLLFRLWMRRGESGCAKVGLAPGR